MVHASLETKWRVQTINCFFRQAQTVAFYLSLVVFHVPFFICCSQQKFTLFFTVALSNDTVSACGAD